MLDKSKKEKVQGFITLGGGLGMSALAIHLLKKGPKITTNGTNLIISESDSDIWGKALLGAGVVSTLSSPFFFVRAGHFKHKARLVLSDESTSFLNQKVSVLSASLRADF